MKTLVLYDSFYGNTAKIAEAIGKAIGEATGAPGEVQVVKADAADFQQLAGVKLLIVGSPTRAFRATPAMSKFLASIPADGLQGVKVAAFDTRMVIDDKTPAFLRVMVRWFGYADKPMMKKLLRKGGQPALPSEGFFVTGTEGPLAEGELERAAEWAKRIVTA